MFSCALRSALPLSLCIRFGYFIAIALKKNELTPLIEAEGMNECGQYVRGYIGTGWEGGRTGGEGGWTGEEGGRM